MAACFNPSRSISPPIWMCPNPFQPWPAREAFPSVHRRRWTPSGWRPYGRPTGVGRDCTRGRVWRWPKPSGAAPRFSMTPSRPGSAATFCGGPAAMRPRPLGRAVRGLRLSAGLAGGRIGRMRKSSRTWSGSAGKSGSFRRPVGPGGWGPAGVVPGGGAACPGRPGRPDDSERIGAWTRLLRWNRNRRNLFLTDSRAVFEWVMDSVPAPDRMVSVELVGSGNRAPEPSPSVGQVLLGGLQSAGGGKPPAACRVAVSGAEPTFSGSLRVHRVAGVRPLDFSGRPRLPRGRRASEPKRPPRGGWTRSSVCSRPDPGRRLRNPSAPVLLKTSAHVGAGLRSDTPLRPYSRSKKHLITLFPNSYG